ncbi:hypothetical protein SAMN04488109_3195 [Chryseolinea serpens]|uniref:Uncharacterized protein n=1 Tax=Chryseolinea serpens TaxID=947013 RepID=A0A1M5R5P6_9BACT|nr:hypothetical protein SAMN04488109_3195 [Chryseolinea serpens]
MIHARGKLQFTKQHALTTGLTCGFFKIALQERKIYKVFIILLYEILLFPFQRSNSLVKSLRSSLA